MNSYASKNVVIGQAFANKLLDTVLNAPADPLFDTAKIHLSKDPAFDPTPASTKAGLAANEADFSGYTAGGYVAVPVPGLNVSPVIQGASVSHTFLAAVASPFVPNNVTGWWIEDGTDVVVGERFADNETFNAASPGDFLDLLAILPVNLLQAAA